MTNPGVQKPHCSPWHSANACCTGLIASGSLPMPSTVVIAWACADTANIRHERIGWPSTSTVQAPHTPCSQPTCVPVRARSWRRKSDSSRRAGARAERTTPLTRTRMSSSGSGVGSPRPPRAHAARAAHAAPSTSWSAVTEASARRVSSAASIRR